MDGKNYLRIFEAGRCLSRREIQQYLAGELSGSQLRRVESHVTGCPLCADALDGFAGFAPSAMELPELDLPDSAAGEGPAQTPPSRRLVSPSPTVRRLAVAAILLPGMLLMLKWLYPRSNEALFQQYYSSYPNDIPLSARSAQPGKPLSPALFQALESYESGDFPTALSLLQDVPGGDAARLAADFYAGLCHMELADYHQAIPFLEKCRQSDTLYASKATWYLALSFLKVGQVPQAKSLLGELAETRGGYRRKDALQLLDSL